ncbi:MAG: RnfABCDGE type electron transport complex subunit D [Clostridiaceae bacterium]|nr:RnfABCDGE type electron transport complex subunit D [Clostridiaceae bacterium]
MMSSSPHIRSKESTRRIMADVIIALLPAVAWGTYYFGPRVLLVALVTVASCVISEFICEKIMKRDITIGDLSAVVTGVLLALNLPPAIPLWIAAIGGIIAIVLIKQIFGGIGQNFMNPALGARVILLLSWTQHMTNWTNPRMPAAADTVSNATQVADAVSTATQIADVAYSVSSVADAVSSATSVADAVSSATPLIYAKTGQDVLGGVARPEYLDLFLGRVLGSIGEISVLVLLIGAAYLLIRKVITLSIPLSYIGTVALLTWILGGDKPFTGDFLYHILAGSLILGAFFMATDYSTSPVMEKGRIIMGIGCGIITVVIRLYSNYPEGVSFAIILMNLLVPLIDKFTIPRAFGGESRIERHN